MKKEQPLTVQQIEAAELVLTRKIDGLSYEQIAERIGISDRTLRRWRDQPNFRTYLRDRAVEIAADSRADVLRALTEKAKRAENAKFIELYLRVTDSFPAERTALSIEDDSRSIDAIEREVAELEAELKRLEERK